MISYADWLSLRERREKNMVKSEHAGRDMKSIGKAIGNGTRTGLAASRGGKPDNVSGWAAAQTVKAAVQ